jgi:ADP-heptose:LPS heptosyltransferase
MRRVLVIKHGALGDFVLATGPFKAIRAHHASDHLTLLTTPPFVGLGRACGWFDEVWTDTRPRLIPPSGWLELVRRLDGARFGRVYDLQTSGRTGWYFRLMRRPRPEWSGIARGCSHPHLNPDRDRMHTVERQAEQLRVAGIEHVPPPDLGWLDADVSHWSLPERYALLVPGGSADRPEKRWPVEGFIDLAGRLLGRGFVPVIVGTLPEREIAARIAASCPEALDLCEQTSLAELASLARRAAIAVGNDTGPMHVAASVGCPSVVLFSRASDPALCAPRGPSVTVLRRDDLAELRPETVAESCRPDRMPARNP